MQPKSSSPSDLSSRSDPTSHSDLISQYRRRDRGLGSGFDLGEQLAALRLRAGLALRDLAARSGLTSKQLQKIEAGHSSPRIDQLQQILAGLGADFEALFSAPDPVRAISRRSLTAADAGRPLPVQYLDQRHLAADLVDKRLLPLCTHLQPGAAVDTPWEQHPGEVFVWVLSGTVVLESELYRPLALAAGDCVYFDGRREYRLHTQGAQGARLLWVTALR